MSSCCTNCNSKTLTFDSETENLVCTHCAVVQPFNNYQHKTFDNVTGGFIGTNVKLGASVLNHNYAYRETKVYLARKVVADILLKLGLTTRENEVNDMIRLITDGEYGMGDWFKVLVGACVCVVMRRARKWLPLGSVCDVVGCDVYELGRMVRRVVEHLEVDLPDFDVVGLFGRVVSEMFKKFCIGKEKLARVMKQGVFLLQCMVKWYVLTGRRPVPAVVAVVVFVCELNGVEMSFEDLASEMNVVVGTCKKRYKELLEKLVDVVRVCLPWGNDVSVKNIMKNAPMVIQYLEVKSTCKRGNEVMSLEEPGACLDRLVNDCLNCGDDSDSIEDCENDRLERLSVLKIKDLKKIKVSPECLSTIYSKFIQEYPNIKTLTKRVENNKIETSGKSKLFVDTTDYWKGNSELSKKLSLDKILETDVGFNAMPPSFVNGCLKTERIKGKIQAAKMRIDKACTSYGFFYLINHGVDEQVLQNVFEQSKLFFSLPLEHKLKYSHNGGDFGFSPLYAENLDPSSKAKADLLPSWRSVMENYYTSLLSTGKKLSSLIALALNLDDHFFHSVGALDKPYAFLRLLHYPGEIGEDEVVYGASAHSDYGMITLLATDGVPGLQVCREKHRHPRTWENVDHVKGAFIVNLGDMMERWTNCLFRSTLHRVMPTGKERFSMAFFLDPNPDCMVECLKSCCSESSPPRFPPIRSGDYLRDRINAAYSS